MNNSIQTRATEWLESIKTTVSANSFSRYAYSVKKHIIPFFENYTYDDVSKLPEAFDDYLKSKKLKIQTKQDLKILLNRILKFSSTDESNDTFETEKDRNEIEPIPEIQLQKLLKALKEDLTPNNIGILFVLYTGLKLGELCALKWSDIDLKNNVIVVNKTLQRISTTSSANKHKKTEVVVIETSARRIPIPTKLLRICLSNAGRPVSYVLSSNNSVVEPRTAQNRLKSLCRKLNIPYNITYNKLRDTFAIRSIESGVNHVVLQEILGVDYSAISKYTKCAKLDMEFEIDKLRY